MDENLIEEIDILLERIYNEGSEILESTKKNSKLNALPIGSRPLEEFFSEPESFEIFQVESFWNLFKMIKENIKNPIVQPWIRVIIEQASDIVYYLGKEEDEKKKISCTYWLCTLGFLGGKHSGMNYDNFLNLLDESVEKNEFTNIRDENYPLRRIHSRWHKIFPSLTEESKIPSFIEEYFLTIKGNNIKKIQLEMFFRDMSLYHHPNLIMNNLEQETRDKSHIFRCFALITLCGLALVRFLSDRTLEDINEKVTIIYQKIGEARGFTNETKKE